MGARARRWPPPQPSPRGGGRSKSRRAVHAALHQRAALQAAQRLGGGVAVECPAVALREAQRHLAAGAAAVGAFALPFDADALAELMAGDESDGQGQTDDDAMPEMPETPVSRPGDVWLLGGHRLFCGDSTVADSYDRLLDGAPVDMVFTDPPYNVNYANSAKDKMRGKDRAILTSTGHTCRTRGGHSG